MRGLVNHFCAINKVISHRKWDLKEIRKCDIVQIIEEVKHIKTWLSYSWGTAHLKSRKAAVNVDWMKRKESPPLQGLNYWRKTDNGKQEVMQYNVARACHTQLDLVTLTLIRMTTARKYWTT